MLEAWIACGNVPFFAGTSAPAAGPATTRIEAELREDTKITQDLSIQIPAPAAMGD
jgi:hypothetical protein